MKASRFGSRATLTGWPRALSSRVKPLSSTTRGTVGCAEVLARKLGLHHRELVVQRHLLRGLLEPEAIQGLESRREGGGPLPEPLALFLLEHRTFVVESRGTMVMGKPAA